MMTQSYYAGSEFDAFQRGSIRPMSNNTYYDRLGPYDHYHEPRHGLRPDYGSRHPAHTLIQEAESMETIGGQSRRRIAVACARCRRRKIKCSGDPGDGSGCQACRHSGANAVDCTFTRVSSREVEFMGANMLPSAASSVAGQTAPYSLPTSSPGSSFGDLGSCLSGSVHQGMHRASLPQLHTRGYASDYENHYENSLVDGYAFGPGSISRQDSFASSYSSQDNHRNYSTSAPLSTAGSSQYYEPQATWNLGPSRSSHSSASRLPSVTAESMSALNSMGSLQSSLPIHPAPERRLPVPYTIQYSQSGHQAQQLPEPRPIDPATANFRPHHMITGLHDRGAMTWNANGTTTSRNNSLALQQTTQPPVSATYRSHHLPTEPCGLPTPTTSSSSATNPNNGLGYIFPSTSYTPDVSPTTTVDSYPSLTGPSAQLSMPPPALRYRNSASALPHPITSEDLSSQTPTGTSSRHREAAANLYSFSMPEASERTGSTTPSEASSVMPRSSAEVQHAASSEGLRRQSDLAGMGHRGSVRSLNGRH